MVFRSTNRVWLNLSLFLTILFLTLSAQTKAESVTPKQSPSHNPTPVKPSGTTVNHRSIIHPSSGSGTGSKFAATPDHGVAKETPRHNLSTAPSTPVILPQASTSPTAIPSTPIKKNLNTATNSVSVPIKLVLKLQEKHVYVYRGEEVVNKYPVAIGKPGTETPTGEWKVMEMIKNPGWTNFKTGQVVKPGPTNPLGERWIGFWSDGKDVIGFHGTPDVKSIGTAASSGCVRMYNDDVRILFDLVKIGTPVRVVR
jgi:lipoprotein-anchoring transpeptidase ErfK/SrfK